ncbi:MAG: DUF2842 domain-containing protein [Hyphomicrobiales bacterium]|jgi:hypothetical protein|nr:MAG: DUF2842 domain-containing protein [Hyphomicrobiales bacterium]
MGAMPHRTSKAMTQSTRKLLGTVLILASLVIWSVLGMWIYMSFLGAAVWWLLIGFFAVMGMSWFYPATWIIRWMAKPDQ